MTSNQNNSKLSSQINSIDHIQRELESTEFEKPDSNTLLDWIKSFFGWQTQTDKELNKLKKEIKEILSKCEQLENENQSLKKRISSLEEKLEQITPKVTKERQEPASTFNPASTTPQHFNLKDNFELYRDNNFQSLSRNLFSTSPNNSTSKQGQEKRYAIAKIHKILAEEILIKGMKLFETDPSKCRSDLNEIKKNFVESVRSCLREENIDIKDDNDENLKALVDESITLVRDMTMAEPPGKLIWQKEDNEAFDPKKHEPKLRSEESGLISLMYHPGYIVDNNIDSILKAWVITKPRQSVKPDNVKNYT